MALDKQIEVDVKGIKSDANDRNAPNREQSAVMYDMLSEGPIYGLHNGLNSIHLNGTPLIDKDQWNIYKPKRTKDGITCSASNTTITVPSDFSSTYHSTDDGDRYIRIQKALATLAGNSSNAGASGTKGESTITTTSSFFTDAMLADDVNNGLYNRIRITGGGPAGTEYVGRMIDRASGTSATISPPLSTTVAHKTIWCDYVSKVTAYNSSTTLTVETAPVLAVSGGPGQISTPKVTSETFQDFLNFKNIHVNFRTGTQNQMAIPRYGETLTPSAAFAITPNEAIKQSNHWQTLSNIPDDYNDTELTSDYDPSEGQANDTIITATGTDSKGMSLTNASDIDTLKLTMKFPGGMYGQKIKTESAGEKSAGHAEFQMFFEYSRDNGSSYNTVQIVGPTDDVINTRGTSDALLKFNTGMQKAHHAWGPVNFNCSKLKTPNNGYIVTYSKSAFFEEWIIPIERWKPFDNWRLIIKKVTADNPLSQDGDWQFQNDSILFAVEAQIHEWLHYPHAAISGIAMNASDFTSTSLPKRQYEIRGIKCQVPTNYHGRYELTSTSDASYTRNVTTGANAGSYQNWDGNMRGDVSTFDYSSVNYQKVWTDNPAWVFYDLCTNKRYGLGNHISSSDIDKYELYQIAQYCDELLDDGKGGTEPRFSANIYLSNSQQAFKVTKDFASVFRGLLYWYNGKLTASTDREKDSVFTFTKGNVIGGAFGYTGSSKKLRTNQVKVTWNDPSILYRQNVHIIEDTQNIVDLNKITSKNVVAYGCTSEAQAKRYGKWHLLSEKLQKEIVSFKTGLNAGFLRPGDVIEVNDADRHRVQFSGRVSNTGTRNTTNIPLDRTITLASGKTYELTLIYPEEGCYLTDNSATSYSGQTFGGHAAALDTLSGGGGYTNGTYTKIPTTGGTGKDLTVNVTVSSNAVSSISINNKGYGYTDNDDITTANYGAFTTSGTKATCKINGLASNTTGVKNGDLLTFIKTQDGAANLRNTSNVAIHTYFSETSRVERQTVDTNAGSVSSLSVDTAFTSTPNPDVIWALIVSSSTSGDVAEDVTGSAKKYQISSIIEDNKNPEFAITALEYIDDKFNAVDRGWKIEAPTVEPLKFGDTVPAPTGVAVEVSIQTAGNPSDTTSSLISDPVQNLQAIVSWAAPVTSRTDSAGNAINTRYDYIAGYEVEHTFSRKLVKSDAYELITVNGSETSIEIPSISIGTYRVRVRTVNTLGNYSKWVVVEGATGTNMPTHPAIRTYLVPTGGELSTTMSQSSGVVSLGAGATQTYTYTNPIGKILTVSSASAAKGTQTFVGMGASATAYLVVDYSVPDLKAIQLKTDTTTTSGTSGVETRFTYWIEVGASTNGLTAASGTVSITAGETKVTGSSTNFDGDFVVGDFIKIGSGTTYNATSDYFRVTKITSDTVMIVDAASGRTYSGATAAYQSFKPNYIFDGIIGEMTTDGSTNYTLKPLASYKADQVTGSDIATTTITGTNIAAGAIDTAQIAADAITNAKIEANSIVAANIVGGTITNAEIAGNTITAANIFANTITSTQISAANGPSVSLTANSVTSVHIGANQVNTSEIVSNSITAVSILANAIGTTQIAANTVNAVIIAQNAVTGVQILTNAVVTEAIASNSVTSASVATNSIGAIAIVAASITTTEIAADTIAAGNIAADAIGSSEVAANAIGAVNISTNSIGAEAIATNSIAALNIVSGSITSVEIASNSIDTAEIVSGSIDALHISSGAITTAKINADAITSAKIVAGAVDSSEIANGAIDTAHIGAGQITTAKIAALQITTALIAADAITEAKIAANTITNASILAGTISTAMIAADAITAAKIASNSIDTAEIVSDSIDTLHISAGSVTNAKISNMSIGKLTAGTLTVTQTVGSGAKILIDGANNRIVISD
jgi:hypothetical protein